MSKAITEARIEQARREFENTAFHEWWKASGHADDPIFTLTMENCAHAAWQERAALSAGQAQPGAIKPLEWELINGWWFGPTAEGQNYIVRASSATNFKGQWLWGLGVDKYELAPSLEAAKAAAQSDYEARIRSALVGGDA